MKVNSICELFKFGWVFTLVMNFQVLICINKYNKGNEYTYGNKHK